MDKNEQQETIQNFGDMVNATERMSAPWQAECERLHKSEDKTKIALVISNFFWAVIVGLLIWFAYMTPVESTQNQTLQDGTQTQTYSQGVTNGE